MTQRVMPPADGLHPTISVFGRTYTCANGSYLDVPDGDATVMAHNGWLMVAQQGVGVTTGRPANPKKGDTFHDTTLGYTIRFDGLVWRNPASGAAV